MTTNAQKLPSYFQKTKKKQARTGSRLNNANSTNRGADDDLQLALALSISLDNCESKTQNSVQPTLQSYNNNNNNITITTSTRVSTCNTSKLKGKSGRVRMIGNKYEAPSLLVTTTEEYNSIIGRRVAQLIGHEQAEVDNSCSKYENMSSHTNNTNSVYDNYDSKSIHSLWEISALNMATSSEHYYVSFFKQGLILNYEDNSPNTTTHNNNSSSSNNNDYDDVSCKLDTNNSSNIIEYDSNNTLLSTSIGRYLYSPFISDTTLLMKDGYKIPAHLFILSAHSILVRDLIAEGYKVTRLPMMGHQMHAILPLLEFMYRGKFSFDCSELREVTRLANILQIDSFISILQVLR